MTATLLMFTISIFSLETIIAICSHRGAEVSDCGRYLVVTLHEGCDPVNRLYYVDLNALSDGVTGRLVLRNIYRSWLQDSNDSKDSTNAAAKFAK